MTNGELFKRLLKENDCEMDYELDMYYSHPYIYLKHNKDIKMADININMHGKYRGMTEEFGTLENYLNLQSCDNFKCFCVDVTYTIEQTKKAIKKAKEWREVVEKS